MKKSKLIPFLRPNLDILFIGLNPANGSSEKGHYFSVNQSFWNQLFDAGLLRYPVNKNVADDLVFGYTDYNFKNWNFGITDLVTTIAESDSSKIKPSFQNTENLVLELKKYKPKTAVILHSKVLTNLCKYLNLKKPKTNSGNMGVLIDDCDTIFYNISFPHGNTITAIQKIEKYKELKIHLLKIKQIYNLNL
jgi:mismatch-specific thymine-DNA glycosylase